MIRCLSQYLHALCVFVALKVKSIKVVKPHACAVFIAGREVLFKFYKAIMFGNKLT